VKLHSLRNTWAALVLASISAILLASCGGGGASQTTTGGALQVLPATGSAYGGVPFTFQIVGGRPPYTLSSSEPGVMAVPSSTSGNSFTVLPANPGVIDQGLPPDALPVRTVNVSARDSNGAINTAVIKVGQNFLTGYGVVVTNTSCPAGTSGTTAGLVCAGGDSVLQMAAVFNGNLYGGREFRLDVLQGNFVLVNPATGTSGTSIGVTSDHAGIITLIARVAANIQTQVGVIKVTDVASGTSTIETFTIKGNASNGILTPLPDTFSFVGPDTATCGSGSGEFLVFDGQPPYTAISSSPNIAVTYIDPNHTPGIFGITVSASGSGTCPSGTIVVTDATNSRGTVTVTSTKGTVAAVVPPAPLQVQPNAITLGCAQSGSVTVIGGSSPGTGSGGSSAPTYSVSSSNSNVTGAVNGNTLTITRAGPAGPGTGGTTTYTLNVTDGSSIVPVSVTAPVTCP
jgi:hypothetical protein